MNGFDSIVARRAAGPALLFALGLLVAAAGDLRARRIPNWLSLPLLACGIAWHGFNEGGGGAGRALLGALVGIGLLFLPFSARLIGGGDVKLLGAVGAWLGTSATLRATLWTAALCGLLVVYLLLRHATLRRQVLTNMRSMLLLQKVVEVEARPRSQTVPVGAAMAAAGLWVAFAERTFAGG